MKNLIANKKGEIIAYELFSPFQYLDKIILDLTNDSNLDRSGGVPVGTPTETQLERSSIPVEQFLSLLNFENKCKLAELPGGIGESARHGKK